MDLFVDALSWAFVGYLVAVMPVLGLRRSRRLRVEAAENPDARLLNYRTTVIRMWITVAVASALFVAQGRHTFGLQLVGPDAGAVWVAALFAAVLLGSTVLFRRLFSNPDRRAHYAKRFQYIAYRLPRTADERHAWIGISFTAGIGEELLFRGFLAITLQSAFNFSDVLTLSIVTGVLFGVAHLYQGPKGMLLTGLVGVVFGSIAWTVGLVVAMFVHAAIDLRILVTPNEVLEMADRLDAAEANAT